MSLDTCPWTPVRRHHEQHPCTRHTSPFTSTHYRADIPAKTSTIPTTVEALGSSGATLLRHDLFTNDILYLDVAFELGSLPADLLPLLPLFSRYGGVGGWVRAVLKGRGAIIEPMC